MEPMDLVKIDVPGNMSFMGSFREFNLWLNQKYGLSFLLLHDEQFNQYHNEWLDELGYEV